MKAMLLPAMPQEAPNGFGMDAGVGIVADLFKANGSPAAAADLPVDRALLKQVLVTAREVR